MKIPFYISIVASSLCLILSIVVFSIGLRNQTLQSDVQKQQEALQAQQQALQAQQVEIDAGVQINQKVGPELLRDMASVSGKNEKMKQLLAKHGYTIQVNTPAPAPATK